MANVWMLATIASGFCFYALRCCQILWYGIVEFVVSLVVIYLTFHPPTTNLILEEVNWWGLDLSRAVGVLAGVYLMVRALDNIEKGLPPVLRANWDWLFHGKRTPADS